MTQEIVPDEIMLISLPTDAEATPSDEGYEPLRDGDERDGDEVEISTGITANGKFVLFGIGGEAGVEGGLRFVFKKADHSK